MDIEKYKAELEAAIYEGPDGRFYIGGEVVKKVLLEAQNQALRIHDVVGRSEQLPTEEALKQGWKDLENSGLDNRLEKWD